MRLTYHPKDWRRWWDFGGGTLGDMGCHYIDLPFWALKLRAPTSIEAEGPPPHAETTPAWLIVRYQFAARGSQPAVQLTWYNGGKVPALVTEGKVPKWSSGVLFVGSKGMLVADYGRRRLLPEKDYEGFQAPAPYLADSIGHHEEWIAACKGGAPALCDFSYAGPLAETVLLGNVAFRSGQKTGVGFRRGQGDQHARCRSVHPAPVSQRLEALAALHFQNCHQRFLRCGLFHSS